MPPLLTDLFCINFGTTLTIVTFVLLNLADQRKSKLSVPSQSTKNSFFFIQEHSYHSADKDSQDKPRPLPSPDCPSSFTSSSSSTDPPSCSSTCSISVPIESSPSLLDKLEIADACASEPGSSEQIQKCCY